MTNKVRASFSRESSARGKQARAPRPTSRGNGRLDPAVVRWYGEHSGLFPRARASTIPMLQSAQAVLGWLPGDAMTTIARHVGVAPAVVEGVASFYAQFRFNAPGRHRVTVCSGTACYVRGSGKLMEDIQANLNVAPGKTTADGAISLESVSCFGACALAPVVVVDDKVLRQQTSASLKEVIKKITAPKPGAGSARRRPVRGVRGARK
jgi:NADH-quinone oxidoreductase subunit E